MQLVGPFEPAPRIAAGVSGGPDSLAMALLLQQWAESRGGSTTALTVDHGLRRESAAEVVQVSRWLAAQGIAHAALRWSPPPLHAGIQAKAREGRYALLTAWCREHEVLHLAVAHHREDQAETLLLRLARGSGLDGLAAMSSVTEADGVRLIRPLLTVAKARLRATLVAREQPWLEDPSNADPVHERVRFRRLMPLLAAEGLSAERLATTARAMGHAREAFDRSVAALLAQTAAVFPAGWVRADQGLLAAPREVSLRALARCLLAVGGEPYGPRLERLERLHGALAESEAARPRTLAGCRVLRHRGAILICREPAREAQSLVLDRAGRFPWDQRFRVELAQAPGDRLLLRHLGVDGWSQAVAAKPELRASALPAPVRWTLPSLWRGERLALVPHLNFCAADSPLDPSNVSVIFAPRHALGPARFRVA